MGQIYINVKYHKPYQKHKSYNTCVTFIFKVQTCTWSMTKRNKRIGLCNHAILKSSTQNLLISVYEFAI